MVEVFELDFYIIHCEIQFCVVFNKITVFNTNSLIQTLLIFNIFEENIIDLSGMMLIYWSKIVKI